ncbi:MAG: S-methyl-5'-thioadenosine phosphorylase [Akkermansiaceae bacterium]|nr:S-methyl-5'-thioadenosine phosphorylase [Akkermansiaceae bacterium]MDP4995196.1 S-methyl-5'-thioadenosine phosphorylase [Akkermansiaceae bacterium]
MNSPALAIIGGSGLYEIDTLEVIARHRIETPFGDPSDEIIEGKLAGRTVFFLPRHGLGHRLLAHEINHRANIWSLRSLNVRYVVSVTAVGSLREEMPPRDVVVPDQLIDRTGRAHEHTFFGNGIAAHVGFADPYSADMRKLLLAAAAKHTEKLHDGGTYVSMNGPAFSTRAESHMHRAMGAHLIGMTNAPEARLCREAEIALATLCLVTDYDCWKDDEAAVDVASVIANLHANSALAKEIVKTLIPSIPTEANFPEHHALATAVLTPRENWPAETIKRLAPILD